MSNKVAPLDELRSFLKVGDNWTQDTRNWPDPTEPRASHPPEPKGCTCHQGEKLDCPVHGLNANPETEKMDHLWSIPEGHPVGYPQDAPRNWSQAVSSVEPGEHVRGTNTHSNYQAGHQIQSDTTNPQNDRAHDIHDFAPSQSLRRQRSGQFGPDQILGSFDPPVMVLDGESEGMESLAHLGDMESGLVSFSPRQQVLPKDEPGQGVGHSDHTGSIEIGSGDVHSFAPHHESDQRPPVSTEILTHYESKNGNDHGIQDPKPTTNEQGQDQDHPGQSVENTKHTTSVAHQASEVKRWKLGKYGKGLLDGDTVITWRIKNGWNGKPHHDKMRKVLGIDHLTVDFHIDQNGMFYFHEQGDCKPPNDPEDSAKLVEAHDMDLEWSHRSVEQVERTTKEGRTQSDELSDLVNMIGTMQKDKKPRKLAIRRNDQGQMAYIEEIF